MGLAPPGVAWDETFYIYYGLHHWRWFSTWGSGGLTRQGIEAYWRAGSEHPPLFPLAIGLAHNVLAGPGPSAATAEPGTAGEGGVFDPIAARGAGVVQHALLVTAVFLFVARRWGRWAGRLAALSVFAMPRVFAHGQLAGGDLPMALTWFLSVWAFARALERRVPRPVLSGRADDDLGTPPVGRVRPGHTAREVLAGVAFGVALLTKVNAVIIPLVLAPWALVVYRRRAIRPLLITCSVGAVLLVAGWPWMWIDTFRHLAGYLSRGTDRGRILVYYLGRSWRDIDVPRHYAAVMTLVTVPAGVAAAAVWGVVGGLRRPGYRVLTALMLANVAVPVAVFSVPRVPVYDGVRLFLHVFPFIACLAGAGAVEVMRWLSARRVRRRVAVWAVVAVATLQVVPLVATLPFGLSYYSLLVGGPAGADRLGFETTYWGDALDGVMWEQVVERVPQGGRVGLFHVPAHEIWPYYADQLERRRFIPVPYAPGGYDYLIVVCRKGYFDETVWDLYRHGTPLAERRLRFLGSVPVCRVYDIRARGGPPEAGTP